MPFPETSSRGARRARLEGRRRESRCAHSSTSILRDAARRKEERRASAPDEVQGVAEPGFSVVTAITLSVPDWAHGGEGVHSAVGRVEPVCRISDGMVLSLNSTEKDHEHFGPPRSHGARGITGPRKL